MSHRVQINFIFTDIVRILCLSWNVKKSKTTYKMYWKKLKQALKLLSCLHYTFTVSFHCSTWIRYQETVILYTRRIKQKCIHILLFRGKCIDYRINEKYSILRISYQPCSREEGGVWFLISLSTVFQLNNGGAFLHI